MEDGVYYLLGLFDVFMPLIYDEGDNAFRRLREEINKQFGGNVAACLGIVDDFRSPGWCQRPAPLNDVDDFSGRASDFG
ncbi:uncharacterized protein Z519_10031 [Cladophialophora bantiana CBS 173.52]|uniref:Uncharacterized protein n=1 Tax=Cladophialophora bantiana (strain ATCC 10958 / CBS 173.52 / CDC B-1940 / NIH 8579) TaxID=1442370 RepID=A0A0D2HX63_CLAB1|nr:uncharacterized protein Z519_10031 [Cladophialophora bantiana CBS 173.52]KIW89179.1 hypothetical protein Z519_10031 [Cladophialophora bantiana CBS 173.52]